VIDIYEAKGMAREDAVKVINTMAKYKSFFVGKLDDVLLSLVI
jgi:hypothetical protein